MPRIVIRTTEEEHARVHELAKAEGLNLSDFARERIGIGRRTPEHHRREVEELHSKVANRAFDFDKRVKQLQARGLTGPVARAMAKQEMDKL